MACGKIEKHKDNISTNKLDNRTEGASLYREAYLNDTKLFHCGASGICHWVLSNMGSSTFICRVVRVTANCA